MVFVAIIGYNIGHIRALHKTPITLNQNADIYTNSGARGKGQGVAQRTGNIGTGAVLSDPRVVVSKKSKTKVYHHTWCSGAARIKEENKLWFETSIAAEAAGYSLAGNCPDL